MLIITPKRMLEKHFEWESQRVPRVPFPTSFLSKCLFTLYSLLFFVALFMYHIFIIVSVAAVIYFLYSYYLFLRLWKLIGLCVWKFNLFFVFTGSILFVSVVFIRSNALQYLTMMGW